MAYELLSGLPPYYDQAHDVSLAIKICQGLRPQFQIKIPQLLEDLIKQCWEASSQKRPTANELERALRKWQKESNNYENTKFTQQLQEAEKYNKTLPDHIKFPKYKIHYEAIYTSRLLPTKEITRLLQNDSGYITGEYDKDIIENKTSSLTKEEWNKWYNISSAFNEELIQSWQNLNFTYEQTQEWINIGLTPQDYLFTNWLKNTKQLTPEQVLNYENAENLIEEYQEKTKKTISFDDKLENELLSIHNELEKTKAEKIELLKQFIDEERKENNQETITKLEKKIEEKNKEIDDLKVKFEEVKKVLIDEQNKLEAKIKQHELIKKE